MLWVLLTWLGYAAALSATVGATAYFAATRFGLVQRLLAAVADRTLSRIADEQQEAFSVTHTDTGVAAEPCLLPPLAAAVPARRRLWGTLVQWSRDGPISASIV